VTAADYLPIIIATIVGFTALAAILLIPVSRFITRERERGDAWNAELERRGQASDASTTTPREPTDAADPSS
jgi:hypothetical protein